MTFCNELTHWIELEICANEYDLALRELDKLKDCDKPLPSCFADNKKALEVPPSREISGAPIVGHPPKL